MRILRLFNIIIGILTLFNKTAPIKAAQKPLAQANKLSSGEALSLMKMDEIGEIGKDCFGADAPRNEDEMDEDR
jgi:hypothetical protein